jgi:phosphatidate cytidylyltransferase
MGEYSWKGYANVTFDSKGVEQTPPAAKEKNSAFLPRLLSALVMVPIAITVVYVGQWALAGFVVFVTAIMSFEWNRLTKQEGQRKSFYGLIAIHTGAVAVAAYFATTDQWTNALYTVVGGIFAILIVTLPKKRSPMWPLLAVPYFTLPGLALIWLRDASAIAASRPAETAGIEVLVWLLFLVWASDVGGYIAGKSIGGWKLAPSISPNKTWAGFLGGTALAGLMGIIAAALTDWGLVQDLLIMSLILSVISQIGDLVESAIKRHFDVKDLSGFIPGHGGVMDRMDGLLFVLVAAALYGLSQDGLLIGLN